MNSQNKSNKDLESSAGIQTTGLRTRLIVENIKCGGCVKTITNSLNEIGFKNTVVDIESSFVEFDNPSTSAQVFDAVSALKKLGYPLVDTEEGLKAVALKAKSYLSCAIGKMS